MTELSHWMIFRPRQLGCLVIALGLVACKTVPKPVPEVEPTQTVENLVVEIFEPEPVAKPEPVPTIDIAEYERRLAEEEAARLALIESQTPPPEPEVKPVVKKTLAQRLASASTPDQKIAILDAEPTSEETVALIRETYESKLAADSASGDNAGAADALVYLGQLDAKGGSRDDDLAALRKFADALSLDPDNAEAPRLVSLSRGRLQGYSDTLHEEAVALFVKQDFEPAVSRWEKVLLIDPGNTAARSWYSQAKQALNR